MNSITFLAEYKQFVTIGHVLFVVIGMGGAVVADILFSFFAANKKLSALEIKIMKKLSQIVLFALFGIIVTGIAIFFSDPVKYINSVKFLTKMTVVFTLCINGFLLHKYVFTRLGIVGYLVDKKYTTLRKLSFALGSISLLSWLTAMSLGVLDRVSITYIQAISIYFCVLVIGIVISQVLRKKLFP